MTHPPLVAPDPDPGSRDAVSDPSVLRAALRGVRAMVLDADGVIVARGRPIPGSLEALAALRRRGVPFRIVSNYSLAHRTTLAARFGAVDVLAADGSSIISAASAAAALTARAFPGGRLLVLATPDALREWEGQTLVSVDDADRPAERVDAVVVGDASNDLPFRALDVAFRRIHGGAALVAMHRNLWWVTPKGPTLDAGALVVGLERATGRRALVAGKPSPVVFRQAVRELRAELRAGDPDAPRLRVDEVAMVGDDVRTDVLAARRLGLRGILVLTGKHGLDDVAAAARASRGGGRPDAVAASLAALMAALD